VPTLSIPSELAASETVARFIYSKNNMSRSLGRPKPAAFYPPPDSRLSVVHSSGLLDHDVWQIGILTLGSQAGRDKIHGRADALVNALLKRKLRAILDHNPFRRHTSVIGWPESANPDEMKQQRKLICLELSQDAEIKLVIPESPIAHSAALTPKV